MSLHSNQIRKITLKIRCSMATPTTTNGYGSTTTVNSVFPTLSGKILTVKNGWTTTQTSLQVQKDRTI